MKTKELKRCQYTPEGIETFGKQRLGYARENRNGGFTVRWDGNKSWSHYAECFIDTSPLLALYTDDEIAQIVKEQEPQITPAMIDSIERNLSYLKNNGLTQKAVIILLKDYIGGTHINKKQIEMVLNGLENLKKHYIKIN